MVKRLLVLSLGSIVVASACTTSGVDPDADIKIAGQVARQDDAAASGARVALSKEPDFFDVIFTVASVGLACLVDEIPNACDDAEVQNVGADGSFSFDRKGRDTQGLVGTASTMGLSASLDPGSGQVRGPGTTIRFQVQTEELNVPLAFWEPNISFSGDAKSAEASWSPLVEASIPDQASVGEAKVDLQFRARGQLIWRFPDQDRSLTFDPRVLEETRGDMAAVAYLDDVDVSVEEGVEWDILLRSGSVAYESEAGIPDSRSKSCSVTRDGETSVLSPCALTDGNFQDVLSPEAACPPEGVCEEASGVTFSIDLEGSLDISLIVVRGCTARCTVETSDDNSSWDAFATGTPPDPSAHDDVILRPPGPTRARYVRVATQEMPSELREVSVFDPVVEQPAEPADPPTPEGIGRVFGDAEDGPGGIPWIWIAIGIGAIAVVAIGVSRRKRRSRPPPSETQTTT